jgi:Tol biopolymer transport system component
LTESPNQQIPMSWHPSGKFLAFRESRAQNNFDIMILPMEGDETSGWNPGKPTIFVDGPSVDREASFSPDGGWLAYQSNESGKYEVYVRPFPGPGGQWQISTGGGEYPRWSRTSKELFYRTPDQRIWVATYETEKDAFRVDKPRLWSEGTFSDRGSQARNFDLHPDGRRFAVLKATEPQRPIDRVVFIANFSEELKRLVPTN